MARTKNFDQVKVALVQMSCAANPAANLAKAVQRIEAAAKKGAKIVCLQELFRSRYFCQSEDHRNFRLAEAIPGRSSDGLGELAQRKKIVIVAIIARCSNGSSSISCRSPSQPNITLRWRVMCSRPASPP